jgi:heme/copper-type cytochrome/quinol oxidase subunit 2
VTLLFFGFVFLVQTLYYIHMAKRLVSQDKLDIKEYQSPLDIWLICIPFCVLMVLSYIFMSWHLVEIFICTTFALIGMLLANALGRGTGKWSFAKSLPFFNGVIASTVFAVIVGGLI